MIAFVCASPVQVMRAVNMKMRYYWCSDKADIYITKWCPNRETLKNNLIVENIFDNVYALDIDSLGKHSVLKLIYGKNDICRLLRSKSYDKLISFNIEDEITQALYNFNKKHKGFEYHCVEDCPNTYMIYEPQKYSWVHPYRYLGIEKQAYGINTWWSSCPKYIKLPQSFATHVEQLKPISKDDSEYLRLINRVFGYEDCTELDNADFLIMDEAYFEDGMMIDNTDFELFCKIKEHYPHNNFLVKMHPRTKNNRYVDNFTIMGKSELPWELYFLNRVASNKKPLVMIGIACGTLTSDRFMFGLDGKKIVLAPLFMNKLRIPNYGIPLITDERIKNYEAIRQEYKNRDDFFIVYNEDDVFDAIDAISRGKNPRGD